MDDGAIPDTVQTLIGEHIASVEQLEVLLLLREDDGREWDADEVGRELQRRPQSARDRLVDLASRGFLREGPGQRYRYAPASAARRRAVDALADTYARRRHAVISLIFA